MSRRPLLFAAALTLVTSSIAFAGPPWVSVELPSNPHHPSTRGAVMLVRAYHHSTSIDTPVRGTAEGIVDGRRISLPLDIARTNQPGVFAVNTPLPRNGTWVLAITVEQSPESTATALVTVNPQGRIANVEVPSDRSRDGWVVPRRIDSDDVEAALRAAHVAFDESAPASGVSLAYALPFLLLGAAAAASRRRQTSV